MAVANATGWVELFNGHMIDATYAMYTAALGTAFVVILFFVFQFMLILKTRNFALSVVTSFVFFGILGWQYLFGMDSQLMGVMGIVLFFEVAGVFYYLFFK